MGVTLRRPKKRVGPVQYQLGRACAYVRISNPGDTREASLETQKDAIIARLRELGYTITDVDVFEDKFTGKETIRRPGLNAMRARVREGVYKAVGVYKLDRLSRVQGHTYVILSEWDELEVRPVSVMEPNIDDSPDGRLFRMMGSYMAQAELGSLEDRFGRGREKIAARGRPLARGVTTYGLIFQKKQDRTYVADEGDGTREGTARWVRVIFEMVAKGHSGYAVVDHLNGLGVAPPGLARGSKYAARGHAGLWSPTAVSKIIKNPAYKGWSVEGKFYSEGVSDAGHSIMRRLPEEMWVIHDRTGAIMPALVSESVWDQANATLERNACNRGSFCKKKHDYLLRGLMTCGQCGGKMYGTKNAGGTIIYRCVNHILVLERPFPESGRCPGKHVRGSWIEPIVWDEFHKLVMTPGQIEAAILRQLEAMPQDTVQGDLDRARANLATQEQVREKFFRKWKEEVARPDCDDDLAAKWEHDYRDLKVLIDSLKKTTETLAREVDRISHPHDVLVEATTRFESIRSRLVEHCDLTPEERHDALRMAGARVIASGDGRRSPPGGAGEVHFYLFDEDDEPTTSLRRSFQFVVPVVVSLD